MLLKEKGRQRLAAKGIEEHVGTYTARGHGQSKVSCQRHKMVGRDLCCPKRRAIKGKPPKA